MFARAHPGGALVGTTTVVVAGFDIVGGSTYATRTIDVTTAVAGGGTITEHTTLTLLHTPGAMP